MNEIQLLFLAIVLNVPIGLIARKRKSLSFPGGVIGAAVIGIITFLAHPLIWGFIVIFFASSTAIGKYKEGSEQKRYAMEYAEKGSERDFLQVIANGGVATLFATVILLNFGISKVPITDLYVILAATSIAASAADTWATEVGTTSNTDPMWILQPWKRVPKGTSGGVSIRGFIGTALGSLIISLTYFAFSLNWIAFIVFFGGVAGSLIDTFLGASVQTVYVCETCNKQTEKQLHKCGEMTRKIRGLPFMNNDMVNFLSGLLACGLVYLII